MIVDANVLLYTVDEHATFHGTAKAWLERALNGHERVGFPWASLLAYQRIITHPRVTTSPLSPNDTWAFIDDWINADLAWIPTPGHRHGDILRDLILTSDARGNLAPDAHLAALAVEYGTSICSFDSDFARFPNVPWINPASA